MATNVSITERIDDLKATYKRMNKRAAADGSYDSPQEIHMCLNCPLPACINCLDSRNAEGNPYKVSRRAFNIATRRAEEMAARNG